MICNFEHICTAHHEETVVAVVVAADAFDLAASNVLRASRKEKAVRTTGINNIVILVSICINNLNNLNN